MKTPETLRDTEEIQADTATDSVHRRQFTLPKAKQLLAERNAQMHDIAHLVRPALLEHIKSTIQREEQAMVQILERAARKKHVQEQYSRVLSEQYFDQRFLKQPRTL